MYAKINASGLIKFPYSFDELRQENPYTNFDMTKPLEDLYSATDDAKQNNASVVPVLVEGKPAEIDPYVKYEQESSPSFSNGQWTLGWNAIQKSKDELDEYESVVAKQVTDKAEANISAITKQQLQDPVWVQYKQELISIHLQAGFPWEVNWPVKPE